MTRVVAHSQERKKDHKSIAAESRCDIGFYWDEKRPFKAACSAESQNTAVRVDRKSVLPVTESAHPGKLNQTRGLVPFA